MTQCPDCGQPLIKVPNAERLFQCPTSLLYYPLSRRGELGDPMPEPPADRIHQQPVEEMAPPPKLTKQTSVLPPNLFHELASKIGEDQISNFIRYIQSELNMKPFQFMMQPTKLKEDVMTRAFPHWLDANGLL